MTTTAAVPATTGKPVKLTDAELAAHARTAILAAHATARYDLAVERWIPVVYGTTPAVVGLQTLLTDAQQITDIAVPHPLLRAARRRWLLALTADIIRTDTAGTTDDWQDAHDANAGFAAAHVDGLLARHADHLWLWHPTSPFLQDQRLAAALTRPHEDRLISELVLHAPSSSSATW